MYKLHSKRCTNSEHPKRDLAIFKCQQVLSGFDVANKTSKKKNRNLLNLCKILPKKKLVSIHEIWPQWGSTHQHTMKDEW
jgi:hypothetical protein